MNFNQGVAESPPVRTLAKRQAVVAAAAQVFLEHGYDSASMDAIAQVAGVSKQTVYNHFPNKETLFAEVAEAQCRRFLELFAATEMAGDDPRSVLLTIGHAMVQTVLAPQSLRLYRIMVAVAPQFAGLGRAFFDMAPRKAVRRLSAYLERETGNGRLAARDPDRAAEHFFGMLTYNIHFRALFGMLEGEDAPERIARRVLDAVDAFLLAYGPRD